MTENLKDLLQNYGEIVATLLHLRSERSGTEHKTLDEYDKSLGAPLPDEPLLLVRMSKSGQARFLEETEHSLPLGGTEHRCIATVWELP